MEHVGRKLYELRRENTLSQKELSLMVGVTPKSISFYENEQRNPSRDVLCKISSIFGVSIDYLLGNSDDPRLPVDRARDKYGFFYTKSERDRIKKLVAEMDENMSIEDRIKICEEDLKQYFSRSVEHNAFDLVNHVSFPKYAGKLLHQKNFAERYGDVHQYLCEKYPPEPGIAERVTKYTIKEKMEEDLSEDVLEIVKILKNLPVPKLEAAKQFVLWLANQKNLD